MYGTSQRAKKVLLFLLFVLILISSRPLSRRGTKKFQMRDSSRSRDNSKTRIDSKDTAPPATIECLDKNSKNNKMIIEKDEVVQVPKKQSSADIDTTIIAEASSENKKVHQNGQHIPPPPPNESNSVKLNNEIPKESKNVTADEGISYNVTGKLKTLGDMIINETKPITESVGKYLHCMISLIVSSAPICTLGSKNHNVMFWS